MIPPNEELRLRSIRRWLSDQQGVHHGEQLEDRAAGLDEQIIEAFEREEDALRDQMMREQRWSTGEGMLSFPMDRIIIWQQVCQDFLPATAEPREED